MLGPATSHPKRCLSLEDFTVKPEQTPNLTLAAPKATVKIQNILPPRIRAGIAPKLRLRKENDSPDPPPGPPGGGAAKNRIKNRLKHKWVTVERSSHQCGRAAD